MKKKLFVTAILLLMLIVNYSIAKTDSATIPPVMPVKALPAFGILTKNDPATDLAKARNCLSCHAVTTKVIGPAYRDIAKKYAGQKDAPAKLAVKIMKGCSGTWGAVPMPAQPQVTATEAVILANWSLSQK